MARLGRRGLDVWESDGGCLVLEVQVTGDQNDRTERWAVDLSTSGTSVPSRISAISSPCGLSARAKTQP